MVTAYDCKKGIQRWMVLWFCITVMKNLSVTEALPIGKDKTHIDNFLYFLLGRKDQIMLPKDFPKSSRLKRTTGNRSRKWKTSVSGLSNLDLIQHVLSQRRNGLSMSVNTSFRAIQQRLRQQQLMRQAGR